MKKETQSVFAGMFALEEIREVLRKTAPTHELEKNEIEIVEKALKKLKKAVRDIEEWLNAQKPSTEG
ncbi:MAG: hypothetical protein DRN25_05790 [Thermoplasmata archaeon]|nr:MAG: hypothetical protein DRN25_05790 [Thermoplasmata archaeon]